MLHLLGSKGVGVGGRGWGKRERVGREGGGRGRGE
jgi:hypothetical protein